MSGGHFDCKYHYELSELLFSVATDTETRRRWPALAEKFYQLGKTLGEIHHDIDWCLSGDSTIENDDEFQNEAMRKIVDSVCRD